MARITRGCLLAVALVVATGAVVTGVAITCANLWLYGLINEIYFVGVATLALASAAAIITGAWSLVRSTKQ